MTYRENLQELIREIWQAYDKVGGMRDAAFDQQPFNDARGKLYDAATALSKHDNALSVGQADSEW